MPPCKIDYPEDAGERAEAPWPFQVFYLIVGFSGSGGLYDPANAEKGIIAAARNRLRRTSGACKAD